MKAAQLAQFGNPPEVIELVDLPDPGPPAAGQVVIDLEAASINPADLLTLTGQYGAKPPELPLVPGAEGVGRVSAVGPGVENVKIGDRVINPGRGNWREKVVAPARALTPLPAAADVLQLAMLKVNPPTAYLMVHRIVDLQAGDWLIQNAANSGVGQSVIRLAKAAGFKTVNVVRRPELIARLTAIGADAVVLDGDDLAARVAEATGGNPPKLGIDAVGGGATRHLAQALAESATLVNYGLLSGRPLEIDARETVFRDLRVRGFWLARWAARATPAEAAEIYGKLGALVVSGQLSVAVEATYPLAEVKAAVAHALRPGRDGKVLLTLPALG